MEYLSLSLSSLLLCSCRFLRARLMRVLVDSDAQQPSAIDLFGIERKCARRRLPSAKTSGPLSLSLSFWLSTCRDDDDDDGRIAGFISQMPDERTQRCARRLLEGARLHPLGRVERCATDTSRNDWDDFAQFSALGLADFRSGKTRPKPLARAQEQPSQLL